MLNLERPVGSPHNAAAWGSDVIADLLRACAFPWISLTPGASFRGLHDSLVNHLGNRAPQILLCVHEEHAVAIAHGFAKVTGRAMPVALHTNVGLMHATMAIFNAWCDRVPMLILGAQGPMDATLRRPWVDWLHTARDRGALVRGYDKWDDQPASVGAAVEAILRARMIAETAPAGPTYVCLDAGFQEERLPAPMAMPPLERFEAPAAPRPDAAGVTAAARLLGEARRPVLLIGRASRAEADWDARVALAERLGATVITDLRVGASFPTRHPLHPFPPGLYLDPRAVEAIGAADVVLSLDWIDLAGTLRQAGGGQWPAGKVIQCSVDHYSHNGWSMDHLGLPPADLRLSTTADAMVAALLSELGPGAAPLPPPARTGRDAAKSGHRGDGLDVETFAATVTAALAAERPSYVRLSIGWPGRLCDFAGPLDYLGFDGGGGIGGGPGMAVGAALALRGSGRLPVAVTGDGDFLMGLTALWTAAHYRIALLVIVSNNSSFFNDEVHQEAVARRRDRPVENRWIGLRMTDPEFDLAALARGQGVEAFGPVSTAERLQEAIEAAVAIVRQGRPCVIDARVAPGYDRSVASGTRGQK